MESLMPKSMSAVDLIPNLTAVSTPKTVTFSQSTLVR